MKTNRKVIISPPPKPWPVNYSDPESPVNPPFESWSSLTGTPGLMRLDAFSCEEIQKYLKEKYGLGVFNLSLPFNYRPNEENTEDQNNL